MIMSEHEGKKYWCTKKNLDLNPLLSLYPCGCLSYNLVLCDATKSLVKSVTLLGFCIDYLVCSLLLDSGGKS